MSSRRLFIYFRVKRESAAEAVAAVCELQASWRVSMPGLHCELLQRIEEADGSVTLMETYSCSGGVSAAWQARIERHTTWRLAPWLIGERHVEIFEPCA